jgi:hypothetical protein
MQRRAAESAGDRARRVIHALCTLAVFTLAIGACSSVPVGSGRVCAPVPVDGMRTPSPSAVDSLAGRYRFKVVTTVGASDPSRNSTTWEVMLARPDSARLAVARELPYRYSVSRVDLRLVGTRRREGTSPDSVEWDDGLLVVGCRFCSRRPTELLMIESVREDGFRGSWIELPPAIDDPRPPSISSRGDEAPLVPSGYFCAVRVGQD